MLAALAAALLIVSPGSWVDSRHGWDARAGCTPFGFLCSTEDGGRTWHGIYVGSRIDNFMRASYSAGAVDDEDVGTFWTRDNGRHWYRTTRIPPTALWRADPARFYASAGASIVRIAGWPPRGAVHCAGRWSANTGAYPPGTGHGRLRRNVCLGSSQNAGLHARRVVHLAGASVADFRLVPGGFAGVALALPDAEAPYVLDAFVWRRGGLRVTSLRVPAHTRLNSDLYEFFASWPNLYIHTIVGRDWTDAGSAGVAGGDVVFVSGDGGATWTEIGP
jgi:hypothetical protein